jgi:tRNA pseudouridine38-40 synthase
VSRFAVTVAYDGTDFFGWQVQPNHRSVQEEIESAFQLLCDGKRPRIHGSGRTDTGVHARGQVFHVDPSRKNYSPDKWRESLNGLLPQDIRILEVREVPADFHARYDAVRKEYRYYIFPARPMPPELRRTRLEVGHSLDWTRMQEAAEALQGRHDFTSFSAARGPEEADAVRTLYALELHPDPDGFYLRAVGEGFLYKMVRRLTGALLMVGGGELSVDAVTNLLMNPNRESCIRTAPPHGLFLWRVHYGAPDED